MFERWQELKFLPLMLSKLDIEVNREIQSCFKSPLLGDVRIIHFTLEVKHHHNMKQLAGTA